MNKNQSEKLEGTAKLKVNNIGFLLLALTITSTLILQDAIDSSFVWSIGL